jgi:hypothetical protein
MPLLIHAFILMNIIVYILYFLYTLTNFEYKYFINIPKYYNN